MNRFTLDKDRRTERGDRQVPTPLPEISLSGPHQYGATQGTSLAKCRPPVRTQFVYLTVHLYSVFFFFIKLNVFVNLTYLYLSEIKKQGLIFSVGMGHLKIFKKI